VKKLLFLRHGDADHTGPPSWSHDSRRPLTVEGIARMALEARGMERLGLRIEAVVTSPYLRARQTADEVIRLYRLADRVVVAEPLEPGGTFRDLVKSLRGVDAEHVLVVGHAPDLGVWVGALTGTGEVPLGKGWLAVVKLKDGLREGTGRLWGVFPADVLVNAGRDGRGTGSS